MTDPRLNRRVTDRRNCLRVARWVVAAFPRRDSLATGLLDCHSGRLVRHDKLCEIQPVLGSVETPLSLQPFVERGRGKRRKLAKDGQTRRPRLDLVDRPLSYPDGIVVHTEDK